MATDSEFTLEIASTTSPLLFLPCATWSPFGGGTNAIKQCERLPVGPVARTGGFQPRFAWSS